VVSGRDFAIVQRLLGLDTRIPPGQTEVLPLAGLVVCAGCGASMVKKSSIAGGKKYDYYICSHNKETKECSSHRIPVGKLEESVLQLLKVHISNILDLQRIMDKIAAVPFQELDIKGLERRIAQKEEETERFKELRNMLYEDMKDGIVSKEDYTELHEAYTEKRSQAEEAVRKMKKEIQDILASNTDKYKWLDYFAQHQDIGSLTRNMAVELIDQVKVTDKKNIEMVFSFHDCYQEIFHNLQHAGCTAEYDSKGRITFEWKEAV